MKKFLTLILVLFIFSLFLGEDIIFDGSLTLKYSVDTSPKLTVTTQNNFLYVGIKGRAFFIGFLSQDPFSMDFSIDQAYGIFNLGFANLFLGPKVQNFKVSPLSGDLWLGGTISSEIPFYFGNIYIAVEPHISNTKSPEVSVLSLNFNLENFILKSVFYNNYSYLEAGLEIPIKNAKVLGYLKYDLLNKNLQNFDTGINLKFNKVDLTFSISPDPSTFQLSEIAISSLYTSNNSYQIGNDITYDSQNSILNVSVYSNYKYEDLLIIPSIKWNSENPTLISGSLELLFNF
ncbi:MAG: hypothetical protein PWP54_1543 [Thermosipho sp. (in: thermotogales)]|nr:hypothetical protein [Thermosipho sp. (in: thermotogales)]